MEPLLLNPVPAVSIKDDPFVAVIAPFDAVIEVTALPSPVVVAVVTVSVNLGELPTSTLLIVLVCISSVVIVSLKVTGPVTVPPAV